MNYFYKFEDEMSAQLKKQNKKPTNKQAKQAKTKTNKTKYD